MKTRKHHASLISRAAAVFALLSLLLLSYPAAGTPVYAEDNTYTTPLFNVDITASEDNSFQVNETIDVDYIYPHHGIYRYIPVQKKFYDVKDIHVYGGDYESSYAK